jgi:hypothetical protein
MRSYLRVLPLVLALAVPTVSAQTGPMPATNVLTVFRESVKVGKGAAHDAHETAWARAVAATRNPTPFIAMSALTGPAEIWYVAAYPTWADYEKTNDATSPAAKAVDKQYRPAETEYLNDSRLMILRARPELGYGGPPNLPNMRYLSVSRISVRPGHTPEYEESRKLVKAAHEAAHVADQFTMWEVTSGAPNGTFYLLVARKSLAELDSGATIHGAAYLAALGGEEGQKKLAAMTASAVTSSQTDHFEFTPSQSVAPAEWIAANPGFWKPKAAPKKAP